MGKREKSFKRKVAKVEEIIRVLSKEYEALPENERWRFRLETRINTKVQLELCVSLRTAREYVKLVQDNQKLFSNQENI